MNALTRKIRQNRVERQSVDGESDCVSSWDELLVRLESNTLEELALGWQEDSYFALSKRRLNELEIILRANTSVRVVRLGWRVHNRRLHAIVRLLKALPPGRLISLQILLLEEWVPEVVLRNLLREQPHLQHLEFGGFQVFRRSTAGQICCAEASRIQAGRRLTPETGVPQNVACDHNIVTRVLGASLPLPFFARLSSLVLSDCQVDNVAAQTLAKWTRAGAGLDSLILRHNRRLDISGLTSLCQANVRNHLDLSLCDLDSFQVQAVATAIAGRDSVLGNLTLAGNYRMDTAGLLSLAEPGVCQKLQGIDVSFCDVGDHRATMVLQKLCMLTQHAPIALERFIMRGACMVGQRASRALCELLQANTPLRVLRLNHERSPTFLSTLQMEEIIRALADNFELCQLRLDWRMETQRDLELDKQMELILALNQAGRRLFRHNPLTAASPTAKEEVVRVVERARDHDDLTVLYCMVLESPMYIVNSLIRC